MFLGIRSSIIINNIDLQVKHWVYGIKIKFVCATDVP